MDETGDAKVPDKQAGSRASSHEFSRFDQVDKPDYHLAEVADGADAFDEDFEFTTVDLSKWLTGDAAERAEFVDQLGSAMHEIGFVILTGHGVDPSLFVELDDAIEAFFDRPLDAKIPFRAERYEAVSEGYFPITETSDIHPDLVEGWVFGRRAFGLEPGVVHDAPAFWPDPTAVPTFRRWVEAGTALFVPLMQAILTWVGCDPHLYDDRLTDPRFGLRLNWYPPYEGLDDGSGAGRLLGHEDIDVFTLLPAPTTEGLQVLHRNGRWVRLDAPPGSIIMNTGDYLQRLSNDLLPSTTHRVSPPRDPADRMQGRTSFPLAAYLSPDDILEALPGTGEAKYEPIKVITFHTRTTAKFYGADYAVDETV